MARPAVSRAVIVIAAAADDIEEVGFDERMTLWQRARIRREDRTRPARIVTRLMRHILRSRRFVRGFRNPDPCAEGETCHSTYSAAAHSDAPLAAPVIHCLIPGYRSVATAMTLWRCSATVDRKQGEGRAGRMVLRPCSIGEDVELLQKRLAARGFSPGNIDGEFNNGTEAAVIAFQRSEGLLPDGVAGPKTLAALGLGSPDDVPNVTPTVTAGIVSQMFPFTPIGK